MSGDSCLSVFAEGSAICASENKKLFVYGGLIDSSESKDELFENASPTRTLMEVHLESITPSICDLPAAPCATVFSTLTATDDKLFLIFGFTREEGWSDDVHLYDKNSKAWNLLDVDSEADAPGPRDKHCSVAVGNRIYVFGGFGPMSEEELQAYSKLYDIEEEKEEEEEKKLSPKEQPEKLSGSASSADESQGDAGKEAGSSMEKPRASRNGHSEVDKAPEQEEEGDDSDDEEDSAGPSVSFSWYNDMWILDTTTQGKATWSQPLYSASVRPTPRAASSLCYYPKKNWLVNFGGRDHGGRRNDVNIFVIEERKWMLDIAEDGPPPTERSYHAACIHNDQLIICGGRDSNDKELNDIFIFDLETFHFKCLTIPEKIQLAPRSCHFIAVYDEKLYITGGVCNFDPELMHCRERVHDCQIIPLGPFFLGSGSGS